MRENSIEGMESKIKLKDCGDLLRHCATECYMSESGMYFLEVESFSDGIKNGTITKESWERFEKDIEKFKLADKESGAIELHTDFDSFQDDKDNIDYVLVCYQDFKNHFEYENKVNERFPNEEFRKIIVEHLLDRHDGTTDIFVSDLEVLKSIQYLNLEKENLSDIKGIEEFESLRKLDISHNPITELNVSNLVGLKELYAYDCDLVDIILPTSETLEILDVTLNKLESLNVEKQSVLTRLSCSGNELSELWLSDCPCLEELYCSNNLLSELDLMDNEVLRILECENNQLTVLSTENIEKLEFCNISGNSISKDGLLRNKIVNDLFPDENFRKAILQEVFYLDDSSDIRESHLSKIRDEKILLIPNSKISDLTGIENFKKLKILDVSYNPLKELDLSRIDTLKKIYAHNCNLTKIDLPSKILTELSYLDVTHNCISKLDLESQVSLKSVYASHNKLQSINLKECEDLEFLACNHNSLTRLDVTDCINLISLECDNNSIKYLQLENNEELKLLSCDRNDLNHLDVSVCPNLKSLSCNNNWIESIDITGVNGLNDISCVGNLRSPQELIEKGIDIEYQPITLKQKLNHIKAHKDNKLSENKLNTNHKKTFKEEMR